MSLVLLLLAGPAFPMCGGLKVPKTKTVPPGAVCAEGGLAAAAQQWGAGCEKNLFDYAARLAAAEPALEPSLADAGRNLHLVLPPQSCGPGGCKAAWDGLSAEEKLVKLWENADDQKGWTAAEKRTFLNAVYAAYERDAGAAYDLEDAYRRTNDECFKFSGNHDRLTSSEFFAAAKTFRLAAGRVDDSVFVRLGGKLPIGGWTKDVNQWESDILKYYSDLASPKDKTEQQLTAARATLDEHARALSGADREKLDRLMDGSIAGKRTLPSSLPALETKASQPPPPPPPTPEEVLEKEKRLDVLMTKVLSDRIRETPTGADVLRRTPAAPTFCLSGGDQPPQCAGKDLGDNKGLFSPIEKTIHIRYDIVREALYTEDNRLRDDPRLKTRDGLRDYLLGAPEMAERAAAHLDVTYTHERTHAMQAHEERRSGTVAARGYPAEHEFEAFATQNRYILERAVRWPDRASSEALRDYDNSRAFIGWVKDRRSLNLAIAGHPDYAKKAQPVADMLGEQQRALAKQDRILDDLEKAKRGCDEQFFDRWKRSCRKEKDELIAAANTQKAGLVEGENYLNRVKNRYDDWLREESDNAPVRGFQARLVMARAASSAWGSHSGALDWLQEARAVPAAVRTDRRVAAYGDVSTFLVLHAEVARLELVARNLYPSVDASRALEDMRKIKTIAAGAAGNGESFSDANLARLTRELQSMHRQQLDCICAGTHYYGEWDGFVGLLVGVNAHRLDGLVPTSDPGRTPQQRQDALRRQACADRGRPEACRL